MKDPWVNSPDLIRRFSDIRPHYEKLCSEVQYILQKRLQAAGIETASVTCRAKTLGSFLAKVDRKSYSDPFKDVADFAGARVVCLYLDDIPAIEGIVQAEFEVDARVDKLAEKKPNEFGYGALHFVVRLGEKSSGARYDDLKDLRCEIQVRTVLQDAWAIIAHHLVYKNEDAIPSTIQRQLNGLAGALETADNQFQQIRKQRQAYVEEVRGSRDEPTRFLATELNLDSYREYLQWRFPDKPVDAFEGQLATNFGITQEAGYRTLADLHNALDDDLLARADHAVKELLYSYRCSITPACAHVTLALIMGNPELARPPWVTPGIFVAIEMYARRKLSNE